MLINKCVLKVKWETCIAVVKTDNCFYQCFGGDSLERASFAVHARRAARATPGKALVLATAFASACAFREVIDFFGAHALMMARGAAGFLTGGSPGPMLAAGLGALGSTGIGRLISAGMIWRRMQSNGANLDRGEYQRCLSEMATSHRARGGKMAFVVPITEVDFADSPFFGEPEPEEEGSRLSDYRQTMKDVAGRYSAVLVDGPKAVRATGLTGNAALQDPVHPTAAGQKALAQSIVTALRQAGW